MNIRKWVPILIGLVIIAFGVGFLSLTFNDNFRITNNNFGRYINVKNNGETVNIGSDGIEVIDGDNYVNVSWRGIKVRDGNDLVEVGWDGIRVHEGGDTKFNLGANWNWFGGSWFNSNSSNMITVDIDEEKFAEIHGINNIKISSDFVSIKVTSQDREDIRMSYYGTMKSNVLPVLKVNRSSSTLNIKLETAKASNFSTIFNNVVLEVFVPESYKDDFSISNSSGSIYLKNIVGENLIASTSSGSIKADNIQAKLIKFSGSSGSIVLDYVEADLLDLTTSSGSIKTDDSIGEIKASTSSGSIILDIGEVKGDVNLSTSSGSIRIALPDNPNYSIKGSSSSGNYIPSKNMIVDENSKGRFRATIGGGDNLINLSTSSGSVIFSD